MWWRGGVKKSIWFSPHKKLLPSGPDAWLRGWSFNIQMANGALNISYEKLWRGLESQWDVNVVALRKGWLHGGKMPGQYCGKEAKEKEEVFSFERRTIFFEVDVPFGVESIASQALTADSDQH